jgi:hypothetical protein
MSDFNYGVSGMWIYLMPNTERAIEAFNGPIAAQSEGTGKFLAIHLPEIRSQLRSAGFTLSKAKRSTIRDEVLLEELGPYYRV